MGKFVSKFTFLPPGRITPLEDNDIILTTKHGSRIQLKIINRYSKFNLLVSHGNAEDISSVYEWAMGKLFKFLNVNVIIYGIFN